MLKALLKKQFLEMGTWFFQDKKHGKLRSKGGIIGYILLYIVICVLLASIFYFMADSLCEPLVASGAAWLYFALMGLVALTLGVFGSVFNTYSSLYNAKDNDLLLSLPVPSSAILMARLMGVYIWGLLFEVLVMLPAQIVYCMTGMATAAALIGSVVVTLLISFLVLTISCLLGWVIAQINARIKHKSIITVIASLVFIAVYYYVYFKAYDMLQQMLANIGTVSEKIGAIYPVYLMGMGAAGDIKSLIIFALIVAALFALVYYWLASSFIKIATTKSKVERTKYKTDMVKCRSLNGALLYREAKRYASSPTYILNCSLGTLMMLAGAVLLAIYGGSVRDFADSFFPPEFRALIAPIAGAAVCFAATMNDLTAPSISLEGKSIWIAQSLPVDAWQVLKAKLKLHLLLTQIPAVILSLMLALVLGTGAVETLEIILVPLIFILLFAALGLMVNLKMPNLNWTEETVAVKQSIGVMIVLFGGWVFLGILGGAIYLLRASIPASLYLPISGVFMAVISALILLWLKNKGAKIYACL